MITREKVVTEAKTWINTPYSLGQKQKHIGVDCTGLLLGIGLELGFILSNIVIENPPIPSTNGHMIKELERFLIPATELLPANILVFERYKLVTHVGILISPTSFIHAGKTKVRSHDLSTGERYAGFARFIHSIYQIPNIV